MKKSFRLALLVCASFVGLALAGSALAAYKPSLTVEQSSYKPGAPFALDLFLAASAKDDPTAKLTIFSPAGYGVNLSKPPGTTVGSAVAFVSISGGAELPVGGAVVVGNPSDPTIMGVSTQCTGKPNNQAVLVLNLSLQGKTIPYPVFANTVGPLTTFQICAPYPEVSATNPYGARILLLDATIKGVFTNPSSPNGYEWSSLFTPYSTTTKTPNPAGTVEWRTYVGVPSTLTLVKVKAKRGVKLVGKLSVRGLNPAGVKLGLYAGKKANPAPGATSLGSGKRITQSAKLKASGKYSMTRPSVKFATFFQTRFENYGTECSGPSPSGLPVPCIGEDIGAVTSNQIKVTKPKKRR